MLTSLFSKWPWKTASNFSPRFGIIINALVVSCARGREAGKLRLWVVNCTHHKHIDHSFNFSNQWLTLLVITPSHLTRKFTACYQSACWQNWLQQFLIITRRNKIVFLRVGGRNHRMSKRRKIAFVEKLRASHFLLSECFLCNVYDVDIQPPVPKY